MRIHGTLTKWNDDRGFGFITPAKGPPDVFVHISAFPRDGVRPQLNELVSFEVEPGKDGKSRAVRIMRPAKKGSRPPPVGARRPAQPMRMARGLLPLLVVAGLGLYSWLRSPEAPPPDPVVVPARQTLVREAQRAPAFSCDGRTRCPEMRSCDEAVYFLRNCPGTEMDGDRDGVPCEDQWCR